MFALLLYYELALHECTREEKTFQQRYYFKIQFNLSYTLF